MRHHYFETTNLANVVMTSTKDIQVASYLVNQSLIKDSSEKYPKPTREATFNNIVLEMRHQYPRND